MRDGRGSATRGRLGRRTGRASLTSPSAPAFECGARSRRASRPKPHAWRGAQRTLLVVVAGVWLALILGVVGSVAQAQSTALAGSATPEANAKGTPTDTPIIQLTSTPTATAQITATATPVVTGTTGISTDTPTVYVNTGPAGPQPTKLVLSQPTVGSGGGGLGGGVLGGGDNAMFITVILGCVTSVLGIVIGGVALLALIRNGYGPFLRALFLGRRAKPATASARGRNGARDARGSRSSGDPGRRLGDGTLNYQETGEASGALWRDPDARQSRRDPHDPRRARDDDYGDYGDYRSYATAGHSRDAGRGRRDRQPSRSEPRSRAGAGRPPSRPNNRSRNGW